MSYGSTEISQLIAEGAELNAWFGWVWCAFRFSSCGRTTTKPKKNRQFFLQTM